MEEKKKENSRDEREKIVVLDEGADMTDMAGTRGGCCLSPYVAIR